MLRKVSWCKFQIGFGKRLELGIVDAIVGLLDGQEMRLLVGVRVASVQTLVWGGCVSFMAVLAPCV